MQLMQQLIVKRFLSSFAALVLLLLPVLAMANSITLSPSWVPANQATALTLLITYSAAPGSTPTFTATTAGGGSTASLTAVSTGTTTKQIISVTTGASVGTVTISDGTNTALLQVGTPQDYSHVVGVPPPCTSLRFKGWYSRLIAARLAACPIPRAYTFYFANSGSDTTGNGTQALPYASKQKAQQIEEANPGGNCAFLFARGSTWSAYQTATATITSGGTVGSTTVGMTGGWAIDEDVAPEIGETITLTGGTSETVTVTGYTLANGNNMPSAITYTPAAANSGHTGISALMPSGLYLDAPNNTVGSYGNGPKPTFSTFNHNYTSGGAFSTAASRGDNLLKSGSISETGTLAAIKELSQNALPLRIMTAASQVDMVPGSWWEDTTNHLVWLHTEDDQNPNSAGRQWTWTAENNAVGIMVMAPGCRIDDIKIEGYGCRKPSDSFDGVAQYSIKGALNNSYQLVISNCDCSYGANHEIGMTQGNGGIHTFYRDKVSCVSGNASAFVDYSSNGGQECIVVDPEYPCPQIPTGIVANNAGVVAFDAHQSVVSFSSTPTVGQATATVSGALVNSDGTSNVPILAGDSLQLGGGTAETLTVASYNPSTGVITFTANIANSGHTSLSYASGPISGAQLSYTSQLTLIVGAHVTLGQYQSTGPFGMPNFPARWSDLANCRAWNIGEIMQKHPPTYGDYNTISVPLNSTSQTTTTVTAAAGTLAGLPAYSYGTAWLTGGTSVPEQIGISGVNNSTGVITLASTIVGASRLNLTYSPLGNGGSNNDYDPILSTVYWCAYINGWFEGGSNALPTSASNANAHSGTVPTSTTLFLNDTFIADFSNSPAGSISRYKGFFGNSTSNNAAFWNCRFSMKAGGKDTACFDTASAASGTVEPTYLYNCILSADGTENNAILGADNVTGHLINNAYAGFAGKTGQAGYDQDPYYVEVSGLTTFGHPSADSPLISANNQLINGTYRLEYDADWLPRSLTTPAIGPYEPVRAAPLYPRDSQ